MESMLLTCIPLSSAASGGEDPIEQSFIRVGFTGADWNDGIWSDFDELLSEMPTPC